MPLTDQQKVIVTAMLSGVSPADETVLAGALARDLSDFVVGILSGKKASKVKTGLQAITKGQVTNWNTLSSVIDSGDSTSFYTDLEDANAAIAAKNGDALFAATLACVISAKKLYSK